MTKPTAGRTPRWCQAPRKKNGAAEAILKFRAPAAIGDLHAYWRYHLRREHERIHHAKYRDSYILAA